MAHAADAPFLTVLVIVLCLTAALAGLNAQQMTSKQVALLGILTALSAVLRALPDQAGSQPSLFCPF